MGAPGRADMMSHAPLPRSILFLPIATRGAELPAMPDTQKKCALKTCDREADPDIEMILAGRRTLRFCCWEHYREWRWDEKSEKTDARMY